MSIIDWNQKTTEELEDFLKTKIILPGTEHYAGSYQGWAATDHLPAMICACENTEDVQAAVVYAQKMKLKLSVRGGGHNWEGLAFADEGLVIDLTRLNSIKIDTTASVALIGGGVKSIALIAAADEHQLVAVTGPSGEVGVAGFVLGGGYGLTTPSHGLGSDNLLAAEVVMADGSLVHTSVTENPDLLWALRGGGGNFGVVTQLQIQLHPAKPLLAGRIMFDLKEAKQILEGYNELMKTAPDELFVLVQVIETPDGKSTLNIAPNWFGDPEEGQLVIDRIRKLGTPLREQISQTNMKSLLESFAPFIINGRRIYAKTRWLTELHPDLTAIIADAVNHKTSPLSVIGLMEIHGAATTVPLADTAFGLRERHFVLLIGSEWTLDDDAQADSHRKWTDDLYEKTARYSIPGGYANLLGKGDQAQIAHAFGSNLEKVQLLKKKFDPDGVFSAIHLPLETDKHSSK